MYAELWFTNNFVLHVKRSKISENLNIYSETEA